MDRGGVVADSNKYGSKMEAGIVAADLFSNRKHIYLLRQFLCKADLLAELR